MPAELIHCAEQVGQAAGVLIKQATHGYCSCGQGSSSGPSYTGSRGWFGRQHPTRMMQQGFGTDSQAWASAEGLVVVGRKGNDCSAPGTVWWEV